MLGCLLLFHVAASYGVQPVHFILQAQKLNTERTGQNFDERLVREQKLLILTITFSQEAETPALSAWYMRIFHLLSLSNGHKLTPFQKTHVPE